MTEPAFDDPGPDDPTLDDVGVLLGSVTVNSDPVNKPFSLETAWFDERRVFVGARAQRIRPPLDVTKLYDLQPRLRNEKTDDYKFLEANDPLLKPPVSLALEANVFAEQNLVVGEDFGVDQSKTPIVPKPKSDFPAKAGNVKVSADLFVQGSLYSLVPAQPPTQPKDQWLTLSETIKRFMPIVLTGIQSVDDPSTLSPTNILTVDVKTDRMGDLTKAQASAAIASLTFNVMSLITANLDPNANLQLSIQSATPNIAKSTPNKIALDIQFAAPTQLLNSKGPVIVALSVSYVIVVPPLDA